MNVNIAKDSLDIANSSYKYKLNTIDHFSNWHNHYITFGDVYTVELVERIKLFDTSRYNFVDIEINFSSHTHVCTSIIMY